MINSTLTGNQAYQSAVGFGGGGAIGSFGGVVTLINTTVVGNTADWDAGGMLANGGELKLENSIVANNVSVNTTRRISILSASQGQY